MRVIMIAIAITTISSFSFVFCFKSNSFPGSTLFPYGTSRREPWERGWLRFNLQPLDLVCSAFQLYHLDISCKYVIILKKHHAKRILNRFCCFALLRLCYYSSVCYYSSAVSCRVRQTKLLSEELKN